MKSNHLVIVLLVFYLIILMGRKNRKGKSKCILEHMTNPKEDNFIDKQFDIMLDPLKDVKFSPKCCPSTYSTDKGCACLTDKTKKLISGRGSNRDNCLSGYF